MDTIKRRRQLLLALLGAPLLVATPGAANAAVLGDALQPKALPGVPLPPVRPRGPRGPRGPRAPYVPAPRRVVPRGPRGPRVPRP
jgi:hypothetical protein